MCKTTPLPAVALAAVACFIGGCASADVKTTKTASRTLPKPDMIIVNDFAVTPDEVKLDRGVAAVAYRDAQGRAPGESEALAGRAVADKLSQKIVEKLTAQGIPAVRADSGVKPTDTSLVLKGQFVTIDQGDQTKRVLIGFGLGGSQLRTRGQMFQNGELVAEGETSTKASLTPGMIGSLGTGSAAGTVGTSLATGAAGAGFSEAFMSNVEADATRTADAVVKRIRSYYVDRGWLPAK